jgi:hypothetical protein
MYCPEAYGQNLLGKPEHFCSISRKVRWLKTDGNLLVFACRRTDISKAHKKRSSGILINALTPVPD